MVAQDTQDRARDHELDRTNAPHKQGDDGCSENNDRKQIEERMRRQLHERDRQRSNNGGTNATRPMASEARDASPAGSVDHLPTEPPVYGVPSG